MGSLIYVSVFYVSSLLAVQWFFSLCNMGNLAQVVENETLLFVIYFIGIVAFGIYVFLKKIDYIKILISTSIVFILSQGILLVLKIDCMGEYPNDFQSFYYYFIITLLRGVIILFPIVVLKLFSKKYKLFF